MKCFREGKSRLGQGTARRQESTAVPLEEDGAGDSALGSQTRHSSWVQEDPVHKRDPKYAREGQIRPGITSTSLKKCLDANFFPPLPSFSGVSQAGTAFPACQGLSASALAAEKSLCHITSSSGRQQRAQRLCSTLHIHVLEKQSGSPVKFPKASGHCCALICEHSRHRGLAAPHRGGSSPRWPPQRHG